MQRHKPQRRSHLPHRQKMKQQPQDKNRPRDAKDNASKSAFS